MISSIMYFDNMLSCTDTQKINALLAEALLAGCQAGNLQGTTRQQRATINSGQAKLSCAPMGMQRGR